MEIVPTTQGKNTLKEMSPALKAAVQAIIDAKVEKQVQEEIAVRMDKIRTEMHLLKQMAEQI